MIILQRPPETVLKVEGTLRMLERAWQDGLQDEQLQRQMTEHFVSLGYHLMILHRGRAGRAVVPSWSSIVEASMLARKCVTVSGGTVILHVPESMRKLNPVEIGRAQWMHGLGWRLLEGGAVLHKRGTTWQLELWTSGEGLTEFQTPVRTREGMHRIGVWQFKGSSYELYKRVREGLVTFSGTMTYTRLEHIISDGEG